MPVVLLSGGLDSAVLLAQAARETEIPPLCVSFDYGQRHRKELWYAQKLAERYGCKFRCEIIHSSLLRGSALTGGSDVPHGHFADPIQSATVVPNRNMVLLSSAAALAVRCGKGVVLFAAHAGDADIYPDCRPEFVAAAREAMRLGCGVEVRAPFLEKTKREVVQLGRELKVPFELTWSCYEGDEKPCGKCGACVEREEALA